MPCIELKLTSRACPQPLTRLRTLLEKPGAAVLRRNFVATSADYEDARVHNKVRVTAVLAVDLTNPPRNEEPESSTPAEETVTDKNEPGETDPLLASFAKGLEIWITDSERAACVFADADEIAGALAMFDAYLRLSRFQPAFERLDHRLVGLHFTFREGLSLGVQGNPAETSSRSAASLDGLAPIPEIEDYRDPRLVVRLPNEGVGYIHDLFRSANSWLEENSYTHILGSK